MSSSPNQRGIALLSAITIALGGCDGGRPQAPSFDQDVRNLQTSNIRSSPGDHPGTNRWTGEPEGSMPIVDVVVPDPRTPAEVPIAAAAHIAVAEVNARMAGALLLRDVPPGGSRQAAHIEIAYLSAYVPPATIDDSAYCSNVSDARGRGAPFRPGPDGRRNHGIAWVNLGNGHCTVSTGQVVHQLAVALGLDAPFDGFAARGPATSAAMWAALELLYANPVGTPAESLRPRRRDTLPAATPDKGQPDVPYVTGA